MGNIIFLRLSMANSTNMDVGFCFNCEKYALYTSRPDQGCFFFELTDLVVSEDKTFPVGVQNSSLRDIDIAEDDMVRKIILK